MLWRERSKKLKDAFQAHTHTFVRASWAKVCSFSSILLALRVFFFFLRWFFRCLLELRSLSWASDVAIFSQLFSPAAHCLSTLRQQEARSEEKEQKVREATETDTSGTHTALERLSVGALTALSVFVCVCEPADRWIALAASEAADFATPKKKEKKKEKEQAERERAHNPILALAALKS